MTCNLNLSIKNILHVRESVTRCLYALDGYTDLSCEESANCFIVSEAGSYMFKAVKGNSDESVSDVASACVLWETLGSLQPIQESALIKDVFYGEGCIAFQTADTFKEGNVSL